MTKLHKSKSDILLSKSKVGRQVLLCSNKVSDCRPSFDFNNMFSEDVALDYLASILVEAFLDKEEYERNKLHQSKESGDLLPSVRQRAG
jgi:hypothetical protein